MVVPNAPATTSAISFLRGKTDAFSIAHFYSHGINFVTTARVTALCVDGVLNQHGENVMKKPKICVHCDARFKNRTSLRSHLIFFHEINLGRTAQKLLTR